MGLAVQRFFMITVILLANIHGAGGFFYIAETNGDIKVVCCSFDILDTRIIIGKSKLFSFFCSICRQAALGEQNCFSLFLFCLFQESFDLFRVSLRISFCPGISVLLLS